MFLTAKKMHGRLIRLINTIIMGAVIIKEIAIHIYSIIRNIGEIRELFLITPQDMFRLAIHEKH